MKNSVEKLNEGDPNNKGKRQLKKKSSFEKIRIEGELRDKFNSECERLLRVFRSNRLLEEKTYYNHIATEYFNKYKPEVERLLEERKGLSKDLHSLQQELDRVKSEITKHEPLSLALQVADSIAARFMDLRMDQLVEASRRLLSNIEDNEKKLGENLGSLDYQRRQILSKSGRRSIDIVESAKLLEKTKKDAKHNLELYNQLNPDHQEALRKQYEDLEKSLEDYKKVVEQAKAPIYNHCSQLNDHVTQYLQGWDANSESSIRDCLVLDPELIELNQEADQKAQEWRKACQNLRKRLQQNNIIWYYMGTLPTGPARALLGALGGYSEYKGEVKRLLEERKGLVRDLHSLQQELDREGDSGPDLMLLAFRVAGHLLDQQETPNHLEAGIEREKRKLEQNLATLDDRKKEFQSHRKALLKSIKFAGNTDVFKVTAKELESLRKVAEEDLERYRQPTPDDKELESLKQAAKEDLEQYIRAVQQAEMLIHQHCSELEGCITEADVSKFRERELESLKKVAEELESLKQAAHDELDWYSQLAPNHEESLQEQYKGLVRYARAEELFHKYQSDLEDYVTEADAFKFAEEELESLKQAAHDELDWYSQLAPNHKESLQEQYKDLEEYVEGVGRAKKSFHEYCSELEEHVIQYLRDIEPYLPRSIIGSVAEYLQHWGARSEHLQHWGDPDRDIRDHLVLNPDIIHHLQN